MMVMHWVRPCGVAMTFAFGREKNPKLLDSRLLSSAVVHSCNIQTLIKPPINMLGPCAPVLLTMGKEPLFIYLFFSTPCFSLLVSSCGREVGSAAY